MLATDLLIYGLIDPRTAELRYVGKSSSGLRRPYAHGQPAQLKRARTYTSNWIRGLVAAGLEYEVLVLGYCADQTALNVAETYWIGLMKLVGCRLTNMTWGGEGIVGYHHTPEAREKISAAGKGNRRSAGATWWKGRKHTPETLVKLSESHKGQRNSPESCERGTAKLRGIARPGYVVAAMQQGLRLSLARKGLRGTFEGKHHTEESKKKSRDSQKGKKKKASSRAKMSATHTGVTLSQSHADAIRAGHAEKRKKMFLKRLTYSFARATVPGFNAEPPRSNKKAYNWKPSPVRETKTRVYTEEARANVTAARQARAARERLLPPRKMTAKTKAKMSTAAFKREAAKRAKENDAT